MDNAIVHAKKDVCRNESEKLSEKNVLLSTVYIDKPQISHFCRYNLFFRHIFGPNKIIPKQIMNLEEKYLHYWLELIHISASLENLSIIPSKVKFFPENFTSRALFLVSTGAENVNIISTRDPIVGSITRNINTMNTLNRPLVRQLGALDDNVSYVKTNALELEVREPSSSSFSSGDFHQGTLRCSWNDGFPRYVFYINNQRDVFTATSSKTKFLSDNGEDYIYKFHSRDKESDLLGEMRVSTSFEFCPHSTQIMETRFVLRVNDCNIEGDTHTSDQTHVKNKGLSKKVAKIFKGRQRLFATQENVLEPSPDGCHFSPPKLELAAIVVKDHIRDSRKEVEVGGWGLKFLKNDGFCESCSSSVNVLVPAGFHGSSGHSSSLVERWKSGGSCDCGGWDLGCPLTVLDARSNHEDGAFVDLFIQGCKRNVRVLKMAKIDDGLYDLRYKSTLSALQSFSVAVAAIHSRDRIPKC